VVEVLDIAGQDEYIALRKQWIMDAEGFLLVYSTTSRSSFARVEGFYNEISNARNSDAPPENGVLGALRTLYYPIVLVGNNADRGSIPEVSTIEGQELALKLGCEFVEASAKECINVEKAFYDVVRGIRRQQQLAAKRQINTGKLQLARNGQYTGRNPTLRGVSQAWRAARGSLLRNPKEDEHSVLKHSD
jgi:GTPase KRas